MAVRLRLRLPVAVAPSHWPAVRKGIGPHANRLLLEIYTLS